MTNKVARRLALTVLISLLTYALACLWSPISWSPDSSKVVFLSFRQLEDEDDDDIRYDHDIVVEVWSGDIETEKCTKLYETDEDKDLLFPPAWSPDGTRVALFEVNDEDSEGEEEGHLLVLLEEGQPPKKYPFRGMALKAKRNDPSICTVAWRPDGKAVVLNALGEDATGVAVVDVVDGKIIWQKKGPSKCSWSPDGKWLAGVILPTEDQDEEENEEENEKERDPDQEVKLILLSAADGAQKVLHTFSGDPAHLFEGGAVAWSPDGKKLCLVAPYSRPKDDDAKEEEEELINIALWIVDIATGQATQKTSDAQPMAPSWSPDGKRVAYCVLHRDRDGDDTERGSSDIVLLDLAAGDRKVLVRGRQPEPLATSPSWSPDGRWIAYRSGELHAKRIPSIVRLISPDGARHKAFYTSDDVMLKMVERLIESYHDSERPLQREPYPEEAAKLLREIRKRFPDTKRGEDIEEIEKKLEKFKELDKSEAILRMVERLGESYHESEQPQEKKLYLEKAVKLLREFRKRFPDAKRGEEVEELQKELEKTLKELHENEGPEEP
ncbi:MAG: PD40 domain-containing protein [Planctomycetes bacterium]|nr:PD40 domain-containing protein [Planctomycetota bacterium]